MPETNMLRTSNAWHLVAGILMALLGVYVWMNPAATLVAMALYLGIVFIVVGAGYFMASFSLESGWYMLVGLLDIFVGVIFVGNLGVTAASIPVIFALWCLAVGIIQVVTAYQMSKLGASWKWTSVAGILGILFAFLILAYPSIGAFTLTALMGLYVILYGVVEIIEYFYFRKISA